MHIIDFSEDQFWLCTLVLKQCLFGGTRSCFGMQGLVPWPGIKPRAPWIRSTFLATEPPGKHPCIYLDNILCNITYLSLFMLKVQCVFKKWGGILLVLFLLVSETQSYNCISFECFALRPPFSHKPCNFYWCCRVWSSQHCMHPLYSFQVPVPQTQSKINLRESGNIQNHMTGMLRGLPDFRHTCSHTYKTAFRYLSLFFHPLPGLLSAGF